MRKIEDKEDDTEEGKWRKERVARVDGEPETMTGIGFGKESRTEVMIITEAEYGHERER